MFDESGKALLKSQINLEGISLIDVLQIAHYLKLNSLLKIISDNGVGLVLLEKGELTHCKIEGKTSGKEAFKQILSWNEYSLRNLPSEKLEKNIDMRFEIILLDSMRQIDEERIADKKNQEKLKSENTESLPNIQIVNHQNHFNENIITSVNNKDILGISIFDISKKSNLSTYIKNDSFQNSIIDSFFNLFLLFKNADINKEELTLINSNNESYIFSDYLIIYKLIKENIVLISFFQYDTKLIMGLRDTREIFQLLTK